MTYAKIPFEVKLRRFFNPLLYEASTDLKCAWRSSVGTWLDRITDGHLQRIRSLLWCHVAVDKRILNARVMLNHPVFAELEIQILHLVDGERMVITTVKIAYLRLLLGNFGRGSCARVGIRTLQAKLRCVHVVLLLALNGCCGEGSSPEKEDAKDDIASVMDIEDVLARHKLLCPEVLPKWCPGVVRNFKSPSNATPFSRDKLIGFDVPLKWCDRRTGGP